MPLDVVITLVKEVNVSMTNYVAYDVGKEVKEAEEDATKEVME